MSVTRYKIWAVGKPVGMGATGSIHVGVHGIAKSNSAGLPNVVINELICNQLAKVLLLDTPNGFIIEKDGNPYYVSMNFNLAGEDLPPADDLAIVTDHPTVSMGIVLFDAWILNGDRHNQNISYDKTTGNLQIYDHSHALFGSGADIEAYLNGVRNNPLVQGNCLIRHIRNLNGLNEWYQKIKSIPDFYIKEVIESTISLGLKPEISNFCIDFIMDRRTRLLEILKNNKHIFPNVPPTDWDAIA